MRFKNQIAFIIAALFCLPTKANTILKYDAEQIKILLEIAKSVQWVNPKLEEGKYLQYATGIYRASQKYGIEPSLLVAIARQETNFKENLPEGAAGELGICQIRKMWINNPHFRKEFPQAKQADLFHTGKNFMYAAWILNDLRKSIKKGSIPYWSFYNSKQFEHRFRYFMLVNKYLSAINYKNLFLPVQEEINQLRKLANLDKKSTEEKITVKSNWIPVAIKKLQPNKGKSLSKLYSDNHVTPAKNLFKYQSASIQD